MPQQQQQQQQPVVVYSSLSDPHSSSTSSAGRDMQLHPQQQDQLWKIIEKQRVIIQGLQKSNAILAAERDGLRDRIAHLEHCLATKDQDGGDGDGDEDGPIPPPRSPYRANNHTKHHSDYSDHHAAAAADSRATSPPPPPPPPFDRRPSTPASPPPPPATPTSPQAIIEKDAQLYAQYQMTVQRKESSTPPATVRNNVRPTPSRSTDAASSYGCRPESPAAANNTNIRPALAKWPSSPENTTISKQSTTDLSLLANNDEPTTTTTTTAEDPLRVLVTRQMEDVQVKVVGSNVKPNEKGREVVSFVISVGKRSTNSTSGRDGYEELWRVEKLYSDILALDTKIKASGDRTIMRKMGKLPDKQLLASNSRAPNKIDQRKVALGQYLQHLVSLAPATTDVREFLSTNVCERDNDFQKTGRKSGYLTKRGRNFGGWKSRYFVINGPVLEYYESKGGAYLGEIKLVNAQLGRQTKPNQTAEDIVYRHAFLIVEQKRSGVPSSLLRHILCANSDEERDEWVEALVRNIRYGDTTTASSHRGGSDNNTNGTSTKKATKKGDRTRKISKVEIRPVAAAPISHMKPTPGADMDKLTSVPAVNVLSSPTELSHTDNEPPTTAAACTSPTSDSGVPDPASSVLSTSLPSSMGGYYQPQLASPPPPPSPQVPAQQQQQQQPPPPPPPHHTPYRATSASRDRPRRNSTSNVSDDDDDDDDGHDPLRRHMLSPIPGAIRSSDDLTLDTGNDMSEHRRVKQKANRVTIWGKKMFSSSSSSSSTTTDATSSSSSTPIPRASTSSSLLGTAAAAAAADGDGGGSGGGGSGGASSRISGMPSGFRNFLSRSSNDSNERHSDDAAAGVGSRHVFGVPLEEAVGISRVVEGYELPSVVYRCIEYLDAKEAVLEEGLYRLSGSNMVIQKLKKKFNQDGDLNLLASKEEYDVHAIAGLLKLWLRELPTTVLTREHRSDFLHVIDLLDRRDRVNELGRLVSLIPLANYTLLRALTAHLLQVVRHSDINKMTVRNISIVFSPTLGIPPSIFNLFMSEFEYIFWTTENGDAAPRMMEKDDPPELHDATGTSSPPPPPSVVPDTTTTTAMDTRPTPETPPVRAPQRRPTLRLREEFGRSNRNSVHYMDGAPNAIVSMEKKVDGAPVRMDEDEDDVDDLAVLKTSDEDSCAEEEEENDSVDQALKSKRYSRLPPPQGLSPMPPSRTTAATFCTTLDVGVQPHPQ